MSYSDEDAVRERFEAERSRRTKASQRAAARVRVITRVVVVLVAAFWSVITILALYVEYPLFVRLLEEYRDGLLPTSFFVVVVVLSTGLFVALALLIYWVWVAWRSQDGLDR